MAWHQAPGGGLMRLVGILTASRSYEFAVDGIRLSALVTPVVGNRIQAVFQFHQAGTGVPPVTFGPVAPTNPPAAMFHHGVLRLDDGREVLIRELYFEARRVVITVSGPSTFIDEVWQRLGTALQGISAADGQPLLGQPREVRDFSEITVDMGFPPSALVPKGLREALRNAGRAVSRSQGRERILVPALRAVFLSDTAEYPGDHPEHFLGPRNTWSLSLRAGARPWEQRFYSAAPLDTQAHLTYLEAVERALGRHQRSPRAGARS